MILTCGLDPLLGVRPSFVWSDSSTTAFVSTGPDQFIIEANGGVGIGTNNPTHALSVTGTDGEIRPGDYLVSSGVPGCAMKYTPEKHPLGYVVARAAEGVKWKNIQRSATGMKKEKISVFFENFVLSLPSAELARTVAARGRNATVAGGG